MKYMLTAGAFNVPMNLALFGGVTEPQPVRKTRPIGYVLHGARGFKLAGGQICKGFGR